MEHQTLRPLIADAFQLHVQLQLFLSPLALLLQNRLPYLLVKAENAGLGRNGLVIHLGKQKNIAHQRGQSAGIEEDFFRVEISLLGVQLAVTLHQGGIALDGIDGGFELVGDIGDKVGFQNFR